MPRPGGCELIDQVSQAEQALQDALARAGDVDLQDVRTATPADDWSLDDNVLRLLMALVETVRPRHILELGSGVSTRALALTCARLRLPCRISSIDHDREFARLTGQQLAQQEGADAVRIQVAPLVARKLADDHAPVYLIRRSQLASSRAVDLALIDGPPESLGGRAGTLYQLLDFARPGTLVLLDDANRPAERAALQSWQRYLENAIQVESLPGFPKGLAAVIIRRPVRTGELPAYHQSRAIDLIREIVPAGASFALVDDYWLTDETLGDLRPMRLMESAGEYAGPPPDDSVAIADLERQREAGADFLIFTALSFWWLEHYSGFHSYLRSSFPCIAESARLIAFDLHADARHRA
jgi:predicted O-methyltransferase YrrM